MPPGNFHSIRNTTPIPLPDDCSKIYLRDAVSSVISV